MLVASEPIHWAAWQKLMAELGLDVPIERIHALVGKTAPEILTILMEEKRPDWDRSKLTEYVQRKNDLYLAESKIGLLPYPGVREGLEWLKKEGIPAAVVSNARKRELNAVLEALDLSKYFAAIISREDARASKPDPTPYLFAAATIGVDPADCVAIDDSPPGLEAGLMAKIPTAAVTTNFDTRAVQNPVPGRPDLRPFWVGSSIAEFFEMISRLPTP